jgi:CBS domain-containing protein
MHSSPHSVRDVMTRTVVAVSRDAAFKQIVQAMEKWKVSAVPVLVGERRVIGIVSEADLLPKEEFRDSDQDFPQPRLRSTGGTLTTRLHLVSNLAKAEAMTAAELMTAPAVTVHGDATLAQAARLMAQHGVKRLPVIDAEGRLEGIVSRTDLLKVFLRPDAELADEIRREVLPHLLPPPDEPIRVKVADGVVTLTGGIGNTSLVPVATRLVRAVEGVVAVEWNLTRGTDTPDAPPHETHGKPQEQPR